MLKDLKRLLHLLVLLKNKGYIHYVSEEDIYILKAFNDWCIKNYHVNVCHLYKSSNSVSYYQNISSYHIIKYLLVNVNNNYSTLKKLLYECHRDGNAYVFDWLADNDIYESSDEPLKYCCADIFVRCVTENYNCIYPINYRYMIRHMPICNYSIYIDSIDVSLMVTHFLQGLSDITKFDIDDINDLRQYTNSDLYWTTVQQIHDLIIALLNEERYIDNMVDLYKVLISFNVLSDKQIELLKAKEAKLIIKGLF